MLVRCHELFSFFSNGDILHWCIKLGELLVPSNEIDPAPCRSILFEHQRNLYPSLSYPAKKSIIMCNIYTRKNNYLYASHRVKLDDF